MVLKYLVIRSQFEELFNFDESFGGIKIWNQLILLMILSQ